MQITLPDGLNLPARARAAGFPSADAYVADLIARADLIAADAAEPVPAEPGGDEPAGPMLVPIPTWPARGERQSSVPERDPRTLSREEFREKLDAILALAKPRGGTADCSRETIYATDEELAARHAAGVAGGEG